MRVAPRLVGVAIAVVAVATSAVWAAGATGASMSRGKPSSGSVPKLVSPGQRADSAPASRTIAGTWSIANGVFEFRRTGDTFTDVVISQRPGVFCPKINDQNGQMVLHQRKALGHDGSRVYTGTWMWYYVGSCRFAGFGRLTVTLWWAGNRGVFVANPPGGLPGGSSHTFFINRVS